MGLSREDFKKKFLEMADGDNKLTRPEMKKYLRQVLHLDISDFAVDNVFDSINKSGDDFITLDEWLDSLDKKSLKDVGEEELKESFNQMDADGSGALNRAEFKKVLDQMHCDLEEEKIDEFINSVDQNKDGKITLKEFCDEFFAEVTE